MGEKLKEAVTRIAAKYPKVIAEVRGLGLLIGVKCGVANTDLQAALRAKGLLTATAGDNVVRLLPPLVIGESEIAEACAMIEGTCAEIAA